MISPTFNLRFFCKTFTACKKEAEERKSERILRCSRGSNGQTNVEPIKEIVGVSDLGDSQIVAKEEETAKKAAKEEAKNPTPLQSKVENLLKEKSIPHHDPDYAALDTAYQEMINSREQSRKNSSIHAKRKTQQPSPHIIRADEEVKSLIRSTTPTNMKMKNVDPKPRSNLQYIFPSTFAERSPLVIPVMNEGMPLSTGENSEEGEANGTKQRRSKKSQIKEVEDAFVPLVNEWTHVL